MTTRRTTVGDRTYDSPRDKKREKNARIERVMKLVKRTPLLVEPPAIFVCEPQGRRKRKLTEYCSEKIEPRLTEESAASAREGKTYRYVVGLIDKSRQNPINKLAGREGGGDKTMEQYWKISKKTTAKLASINGSENVGLFLTRVAPTSDEGLMAVGGMTLPEKAGIQFLACWRESVREIELRKQDYEVEIAVNGRKVSFRNDLHAFSQVLRHPELVTACNYIITPPTVLDPNAEPGYIQEAIRNLENREVRFYEQLPHSLKGRNDGAAEVVSPFRMSLEQIEAMGFERPKGGMFFEIKLRMADDEARQLLRFTRATRKGYAEIFSGKIGMRGLNTFTGKARTNGILGPITHAMMDLRNETGLNVIPVNGGYLQYWTSAGPEAVEQIKMAIRRRINSGKNKNGYANIGLEPTVSVLNARGVSLDELRARFILDSLGRGTYEVNVLEATDFLLNFVENVNEGVQNQIFDNLLGEKDRKDRAYIKMMKKVCSSRRTVRDTEDFIWILRNDDALPEKIKAKKKEIEGWLFEFAAENAAEIHLQLSRTIEAIGNKRDGKSS